MNIWEEYWSMQPERTHPACRHRKCMTHSLTITTGPTGTSLQQLRHRYWRERMTLTTGKITKTEGKNLFIHPKVKCFLKCTLYPWFVVITAVNTSIMVFWVVTPCNSLVGDYQRFRGTYRLRFQGWRWSRYVPLKRWEPPIRLLHGVTTQKTTIDPLSAFRLNVALRPSVRTRAYCCDNTVQGHCCNNVIQGQLQQCDPRTLLLLLPRSFM
jgi:hypothetical protein